MIYDGETQRRSGGAPTTYDQGTLSARQFLGADERCMLSANYTMNSMTSSGILPQYGLPIIIPVFNAILFRWMARFVRDQGLQNNYQYWLQDNANAAWNFRRTSDNLSWCQWQQQPHWAPTFILGTVFLPWKRCKLCRPTQSTSPGAVLLCPAMLPDLQLYQRRKLVQWGSPHLEQQLCCGRS